MELFGVVLLNFEFDVVSLKTWNHRVAQLNQSWLSMLHNKLP